MLTGHRPMRRQSFRSPPIEQETDLVAEPNTAMLEP